MTATWKALVAMGVLSLGACGFLTAKEAADATKKCEGETRDARNPAAALRKVLRSTDEVREYYERNRETIDFAIETSTSKELRSLLWTTCMAGEGAECSEGEPPTKPPGEVCSFASEDVRATVENPFFPR